MGTLEELGRSKIKELLSKCNDLERDIFNRMYESPDIITLDKMDWAIQQIENTLTMKGK